MGLDNGLARNLRAQCDCVDHTRHCDYCRAEDEIARLRAIVGWAIFNTDTTPARLKASTGIDLDDDDVESITEDAAEWMRQYAWARDSGSNPAHVVPIMQKAGGA